MSGLEAVLAKRPSAGIIPDETFSTRPFPIPDASSLKEGQLLVETLYLSIDPITRMWLDGVDYMPLDIGGRIPSWNLVRVVSSAAPAVAPGTLGIAFSGWSTHAVVEAAELDTFPVPEGMDTADILSVMGSTGLTGYFGILRVAQPKKGDTVVVSAAAGATGSAAAQIARIQGAARVVGITGSDAKCAWLKDTLKLDEAVNYKAPDFKERFAKAVEGGIDVYWDNVGGDQLELVLENMKMHGRIAICGQVSGYNAPGQVGVTNLYKVFEKCLTLVGFNIFEYLHETGPAREQLSKWYLEGKLLGTSTVRKGGVEDAGAALVAMFAGENAGKLVVKLKD